MTLQPRRPARVRLPPNVHVFVRDWLSGNNVVLKGADGCVIVDSGHVKHAPLTLALIASRMGLDGRPLSKLVNTHCHSDHMGGNAAVKRAYRCPIAVPEGEAPLVDAWDERGLLLGYADQRAERFAVDEILRPDTHEAWGDLEWRLLAAPGHDTAALIFFNDEHGILIAGDALWENGYGLVMPPEIDPGALPAAQATLEMIGTLNARCVIPGHGEPFADVDEALERARRRTTTLVADPLRAARHVLKVMLMFSLLDRERMSIASLPAYVDSIPVYREFNARFFKLAPAALAAELVSALQRSGAVNVENGELLKRN